MKQKLFALVLGSLLLAAGLLSCSSPLGSKAGSASVPGQVVLSVTDGRTLAPKSLDLTPASYKAVFSPTSGTPVEVTFQAGESKSVSLATGPWTVALEALNQGSAVVGRASASASVESGKTTAVALTLNPVDGKGRFKLTASLEGLVAASPSLSGKLTPADGTTAADFTFTASGALQVADLLVDDGSYLLQVTLKDGVSELAVGIETVYVVTDAVTEGGLKFNTSGAKPVAQISLDIPVNNRVATPVLTPAAGQVPAGTSVAFSSSTSGAIFRYTTDGTEPTASSTSGTSYAVQGNVTLKVKAFKDGMTASDTASAAYTIPGEVYDGIRVYVTDTMTHVYYWALTFDAGAAVLPVSGEPGIVADAAKGYGVWRAVELPKANKASVIGKGADWTNKTADLLITAKGSYWIHPTTKVMTTYDPLKPVEPVITATPDTAVKYNTTQSITLKGSNADDVIYYTLDGSAPTASSTKYAGAFDITPKTTVTVVKAYGVNREGTAGAVATFTFDIKSTNDILPPTVTANPGAGNYPAGITAQFTVTDDKAGVYSYYTTDGSEPTTASSSLALSATGTSATSASINVAASMRVKVLVVDAQGNQTRKSFTFRIGPNTRDDFRKESIYFLMTTRFYDGDQSNNVRAWDEVLIDPNFASNNDPAWRGDFKGLIQKLDYIKALGFSAIWITPPVKNMSGLDYHGYHAVDFKEIDPRYKSAEDMDANAAYQKLIDAVHAKGMKVVQDIVLNHSSNFGEENLFPLYEKDAAGFNGAYKNKSNAAQLIPNADLLAAAGRLAAQQGKTVEWILANQPYQARLEVLKTEAGDPNILYKHNPQTVWNSWLQQEGDMAGDCRELNTENPITANYLNEAYEQYINMGVDAFRIDTVKHISRVTFNNTFLPKFREVGGDKFFYFGECANIYSSVWDNGIPAQSGPYYTWKESKNYAWSTDASQWGVNYKTTAVNYQTTQTHFADYISDVSEFNSQNHLLNGNNYRTKDYSKSNGFGMIDFTMHHNFANAGAAYGVGLSFDHTYNDATWNVTYVDSHDYGPNNNGGLLRRYAEGEGSLAENMSLMFTFRGIPTVYYGTEVQFMKGAQIEPWTGSGKVPFAQSGRAYFGDFLEGSVTASEFGKYDSASGTVKATLDHPLAKHIANLNRIRRAVPALQMGQYSTEGISGGVASFKRRYTDADTDSFALVVISGSATFSGIPNGTYKDAVTGNVINVTGGSLTADAAGQANARIYVLDTAKTPAPGKVADSGLAYLK